MSNSSGGKSFTGILQQGGGENCDNRDESK